MLGSEEHRGIIDAFKPLMDYLSATFGPQKSVLYEVDPETGDSRAVLSKLPEVLPGDKLGNVGTQVLLNSDKGYNYLINAEINGGEGIQEKISYFLIRDKKQQVIGVLMIVLEIGHLLTFKLMLDQVLGFEPIDDRPMEFNDLYHELESENFSLSKYAADIIGSVIAETSIPVQRMTMDEKAQILYRLNELEIFKLKGSTKEATSQLMISQATLYRLLKREEEK